jgi:hypothetical protein
MAARELSVGGGWRAVFPGSSKTMTQALRQEKCLLIKGVGYSLQPRTELQ